MCNGLMFETQKKVGFGFGFSTKYKSKPNEIQIKNLILLHFGIEIKKNKSNVNRN